MKEANLISIISAYKKLSPELFDLYLKHNSITLKIDEIADLEAFVSCVKDLNNDLALFDNYFIGYSIPQIGKEFDLLRIGLASIINIELKQTNTGDKIKKQLERNEYYLSFLNKKVCSFTFVTDEKKLYNLDDNGDLVQTDFSFLLDVLYDNKAEKVNSIDGFFNPSNYLVSPFNSTEKFMQEKYFLTIHQEAIKKKVKQSIQSHGFSILSIKGKAGTGKSLLTYDLAKDLISLDKNVLIVHCGYLNEGHFTLRDEYNWDIISIKNIACEKLKIYDLIIIDEVQRIYPHQLQNIIQEVKKNSLNCIFSYDAQQCLKSSEINNNIEAQIEGEITSPVFELTTKIRTNKEIALFIKALFDKTTPLTISNFSNIELNYFSRYEDVRDFLEMKNNNGWKVINYTSTYNRLAYDNYHLHSVHDNSHTVIGQEFDNVVVVIDQHFCYQNNILAIHKYSRRPHYMITKMLFQNLTRARIRLSVVILNNEEMLKRCLDILK